MERMDEDSIKIYQDEVLAQSVKLEISGVYNTLAEDLSETHFEACDCESPEATMHAVYGVDAKGCAAHLEDFATYAEARKFAEDIGGLPIGERRSVKVPVAQVEKQDGGIELVLITTGFYGARELPQGVDYVGWLSLDPCNGFEVYVGPEWPTSRRIGSHFRLDKAKDMLQAHLKVAREEKLNG